MIDFKSTLFLAFAALFFVAAQCRGALVDQQAAVDAVEAMGITDAEIIEHAFVAVNLRGCSNSDAARFTVRGTNARGKPVTVYVCNGWLFKGATVRTW